MRLVTEEQTRRLGGAPNVTAVSSELLQEPVGSAIRAFLALSQRPEVFTAAGWSPEEVFWSRYFWARRVVNLNSAARGPDAGLEQQASQVLEHPLPSCTPDWSLLESVESQASIA